MRISAVLIGIIMVSGAIAFSATPALTQEAKTMSVDELKGMLGNTDVMVIDVRSATDWDSSNLKIKGAVREDPEKAETWMSKFPKDKILVFY